MICDQTKKYNIMCWPLIFALSFLVAKTSACSAPVLANISVQSNFSLSRFLGVWYEVEWLPAEPHAESDIWRDFYQSYQYENGSTERLHVPGQARVLGNSTCFSIGPWTIIANNSAKMILERKGPDNTTGLNWPYYVLRTDYEHYALIYGCTTHNHVLTDLCPDPILWLFSRTVVLAPQYLKSMNDLIETTLCINLTRLEITPHANTTCYKSSSLSAAFLSPSLLLGWIVLLLSHHLTWTSFLIFIFISNIHRNVSDKREQKKNWRTDLILPLEIINRQLSCEEYEIHVSRPRNNNERCRKIRSPQNHRSYVQ